MCDWETLCVSVSILGQTIYAIDSFYYFTTLKHCWGLVTIISLSITHNRQFDT